MGKNDFLARQAAMMNGFLEAGREIGRQEMWDAIQAVLNDSDVMGKDTFGAKRLDKIYAALQIVVSTYQVALTDDKEADYYQEKLDQKLRAIWKDRLVPYKDRYPNIKQQGYLKGKKNWR